MQRCEPALANLISFGLQGIAACSILELARAHLLCNTANPVFHILLLEAERLYGIG